MVASSFRWVFLWVFSCGILSGTLLAEGDSQTRTDLHHSYVPASPDHAGRTCLAQLVVPKSRNQHPLPLLLEFAGTGKYSMAQLTLENPLNQYLLKKKWIAILTVNRPGIGKVPEEYDDAIYKQHLPSDLIYCGMRALEWALEKKEINETQQIILKGHSEGTKIVSQIYRSLLKNNSPMAQNIKLLILSGTPVEDVWSILESQLPSEELAKFKNASKENDEEFIMTRTGLPLRYFTADIASDTNFKIFEDLYALRASAEFQFYHGMYDSNCPVQKLQNYMIRNQNREKPLFMEARYYHAEHGLNMTALNDMIRTIALSLSERE